MNPLTRSLFSSTLLSLFALALVGCGGEDDPTDTDMSMVPACPTTGAVIAAAPRVFEFDTIPAGTSAQRDLLINSGGEGQACFDAMFVTLDPADAPFTVGPIILGGNAVTALDPGQNGSVTFTFNPTSEIVDGRATATITSTNGNTAEVDLRYSASASTTASLGTVTVDAAIPFIYDATRIDDAMYRDENGGVLPTAGISGTFDDAAVPPAGVVQTWAIHDAEGTIELWQEVFATTAFELPTVDPGFRIIFPSDDLTAGVLPLSLTAAGDSPIVITTGVNIDGTTCVSGIGSGSLTVADPMNTTAIDGGSFSVTGSVTLYPPQNTPDGDATSALAALGFARCEAGPQGGPVFVRIDDTSAVGTMLEDGADIDAIGLFKADGDVVWAEAVVNYVHAAGLGDMVDANEATGAPDAFDQYPDLTSCTIDGGAVPLGGTGGSLVLRFPVGIQEGDRLQVLEVGDCDFGGAQAIGENVSVFVGKTADIEGEWVSVGTTNGGAQTMTVPALEFGM